MKDHLPWILLLVLSACSSADPEVGRKESYGDFDANKDYFQEKVTIGYAQNFTVTYHKNYKVVRTKVGFEKADKGIDSTAWERTFTDLMVLVQRGTPGPPLVGELANSVVIEIPARSVAGNSDDAPTRLMAVSPLENIVGLGHKDIYNPALKARIDQGKIAPIGASWHSGPNLEVLLSIKPDITFLIAASLTQADGIKRTRRMGLQVAPDFAWSETSYLGQLEWIKYDALFLNTEAKANVFFKEIKERCDSFKQLVQRTSLDRPEVMWGMHSKGGFWMIRMNGAIAQLMEDAGSQNPFENGSQAEAKRIATGLSEGVAVSDEIVLEKARAVQCIISFQQTTQNWPTENYMNTIPAFQNRELYHHFKRYKKNGASDWYQSASMRPDVLMKDLIKLFHPELLPGHELYFLEKIQLK